MPRPKLLLADDSVTIRKVVELTFADEGVAVTTASSAEEAMQKFIEVRPDIVLVDVHMPDPSGYKICETIKSDEATRHIPVLLLVGSFEPFDQAEAERVGADGVLTKPFQSIKTLVTTVRELLGTENTVAVSHEATSDIDALYGSSVASVAKEADGESVEIHLGDPGMDDEMIETSHPLQDGEKPDGKTDAGSPKRDKTPEFANPDTIEAFSAEEPSDAFIALIAQRVVEKLSDKVIREIAQKEVPKITERLIREALADEKKI